MRLVRSLTVAWSEGAVCGGSSRVNTIDFIFPNIANMYCTECIIGIIQNSGTPERARDRVAAAERRIDNDCTNNANRGRAGLERAQLELSVISRNYACAASLAAPPSNRNDFLPVAVGTRVTSRPPPDPYLQLSRIRFPPQVLTIKHGSLTYVSRHQDPFARDVLFDPGGTTMPSITASHMLRPTICTVSASAT